MADALIALHFQNDICHPDGRIPFSLNRNTPEAEAFLAASARALAAARKKGWTIAHVHIGFADDYSDLPWNSRLFRKAADFGAVKRGSWGAAPFAGFEPLPGEIVISRPCNSAFHNTGLEALLRQAGVDRLHVMGLATQFSVESTVRAASDMNYRVAILADCCAAADMDAHRASLKTLAMLADIIMSDTLV
ncbi:MAG: isochorismatase family cysteine hydrolase [Bauldia sp.]